MSSSTTKLHSRGNTMPPVDSPWPQTPLEFLLQLWLWFSCYPAWSWLIGRLCLQARAVWQAFVIVSNKVLFKAPSISVKAPSVISLFSSTSSICVITRCSVLSVHFPCWYANWYWYKGHSPRSSSLICLANFSTIFSMKDDRLIRQCALALVYLSFLCLSINITLIYLQYARTVIWLMRSQLTLLLLGTKGSAVKTMLELWVG